MRVEEFVAKLRAKPQFGEVKLELERCRSIYFFHEVEDLLGNIIVGQAKGEIACGASWCSRSMQS